MNNYIAILDRYFSTKQHRNSPQNDPELDAALKWGASQQDGVRLPNVGLIVFDLKDEYFEIHRSIPAQLRRRLSHSPSLPAATTAVPQIPMPNCLLPGMFFEGPSGSGKTTNPVIYRHSGIRQDFQVDEDTNL